MDRLDVVILVDECPTNLVAHLVVEYLWVILPGDLEEVLLVHDRVGFR